MTDPLKILNTIEAEDMGALKQFAAVSPERLQSLRKAIEAQADRIAHQDQRHTECAENLVKAREELAQAKKLYNERIQTGSKLLEELAQKDARIARLEDAIDPNPPAGYEAWLIGLDEALNEHPRQSLAAVKAEALREAATAFETLGPDPFGEYLRERADRIEQEAKEES